LFLVNFAQEGAEVTDIFRFDERQLVAHDCGLAKLSHVTGVTLWN